MKSHERIYTFPELVTFRYNPEFIICEDDSILPKNGMIETTELHFSIREESGEYTLCVFLHEDVVPDGEHEYIIEFWNEGGLSLEQIKNDIEQVLEKKGIVYLIFSLYIFPEKD